MIADIKKDIETHFQNGWSDTPIQWEGIDFESPDEWISLKVIPITATANTCKRVFSNLQLQVLCYSTNHTKVMELSDKVSNFASCVDLTTCHIQVGSYDGLGCISLDNGVSFLNTVFEVDSLN